MATAMVSSWSGLDTHFAVATATEKNGFNAIKCECSHWKGEQWQHMYLDVSCHCWTLMMKNKFSVAIVVTQCEQTFKAHSNWDGNGNGKLFFLFAMNGLCGIKWGCSHGDRWQWQWQQHCWLMGCGPFCDSNSNGKKLCQIQTYICIFPLPSVTMWTASFDSTQPIHDEKKKIVFHCHWKSTSYEHLQRCRCHCRCRHSVWTSL